jgi:hypothetical protein
LLKFRTVFISNLLLFSPFLLQARFFCLDNSARACGVVARVKLAFQRLFGLKNKSTWGLLWTRKMIFYSRKIESFDLFFGMSRKTFIKIVFIFSLKGWQCLSETKYNFSIIAMNQVTVKCQFSRGCNLLIPFCTT